MNSKTYTLITGASSGIGYDLALIAAAEKKNLILVARSANKLDQLAKKIMENNNTEVITFRVDLSANSEVTHFISELSIQNLQIDTLINNAGFGDFGNFADADLSKIIQMNHLNINTLTRLTHYVLQDMIKNQKGQIMNIASTAAFMPGPGMAVYYASKAYVLSFSEAIARELKGSGVTVTTLCPGPTDTGFASAAGLGKSLLHRLLPAATSMQVAKAGYKAMLKGKSLEVPGLMNKLSIITPRLLPRSLVKNLIYNIHQNH